MLETSRLWWAAPAVLMAACAAPEPQVVKAPVAPPQPVSIAPVRDETSVAEEAKALLAQAETDVQRARARRALWLKAWEDLLAARHAVAAKQNAAAIRHAKRASELAQLGLEQLAYPAVK
ncbi:MAG TPA: hypothetical protein VM051_01925 [Usitatibacter sp.]|nr:hypothetical protein [Usitatibacter sp.]